MEECLFPIDALVFWWPTWSKNLGRSLLGTDGKPTTDANEAFYNGKGLMPLGGEEINSGYKGYGLGMLVDILCGIMSGSNNGPNIRHWNNYVGEVANLGHFFVAIDPDYFAPDFKDRLQVIFFL